jgi:hypothetical protein
VAYPITWKRSVNVGTAFESDLAFGINLGPAAGPIFDLLHKHLRINGKAVFKAYLSEDDFQS